MVTVQNIKDKLKSNKTIVLLYKKLRMLCKLSSIIKNKNRYKKSYDEIEKLKNKYQGKRCFIVGNGPSLTVEDLEKLKDEITFASHKIYIIFEDTSWRPTYYTAQDALLIAKETKEISKITSPKIISLLQDYKYENIDNTLYLKLDCTTADNDFPLFSEDIKKCVYEGMTVSYSNIQIAVYMGFKEIYLIGVDHNYSVERKADGSIQYNNDVKDYFSNKYMSNEFKTGEFNLPNTQKSTLGYMAAKKYADEHGIKIYNATRGGKLEVFERADLDEVIANC